MLAALGLLGFTEIHRMNALKNMFAFLINGIAALVFVLSGAVNWPDVLLMAVGSVSGGYTGAGLALRLGSTFINRVVIAIGLIMSLSLLLHR
jgi:uncharacterized membrane protein YfcA